MSPSLSSTSDAAMAVMVNLKGVKVPALMALLMMLIVALKSPVVVGVIVIPMVSLPVAVMSAAGWGEMAASLLSELTEMFARSRA